jgi:hypothetical protein
LSKHIRRKTASSPPAENKPLSSKKWRHLTTRHAIFALWLYILLLAVASAALHKSSAHSESRLATIESLVTHGTFAIDASTYANTVDKVKIGSHFYSHQPPAHAVLAAPLYFPLYHLGLRFGPGANAAYAILTFATNGLSTVFALVLFFRALAWLQLSESTRVWLTAGLACGTLLLPYSTTFNAHGLVGAWLFIGFYYFVRSGMARGSAAIWVSGLIFSTCAAIDHGTVLFFAAFFIALLFRGDRRVDAFRFALPALVSLLPTALYYYGIGGSLKPFAARLELFAYEGSPWLNHSSLYADALTGAGWNSPGFALRYGFLCLFGPRGFLVYNPLALATLAGMVVTIRRRLAFWQEAVAIAAASAAMMTYYFLASTNYSGWSYSIRWFVAMLPLWFFFTAAVWQWLLRMKWLVIALAAASVIYAAGGVADPWPVPRQTLGYLTPIVNLNGLRAPSNSLKMEFSPNPVSRDGDGTWSFQVTLREQGGVGVKLTQFVVGAIDRSWGLSTAFRGNHLSANGTANARLKLSGYSPPHDLTFRVGGENDYGRMVVATGMVTLLP